MPIIINNKTYYKTSEACQIAGVSRATFFRWLNKGIIAEVKYRDRRGWRLFTEKDINKIKAEASKINLSKEL